MGDWYAREMYFEGQPKYRHHTATYGHPSQVGFKDVIRRWKAARWQPDELLALYKQAGARYFMALANHHDNFDLYDSRHQPWNATRLGPPARPDRRLGRHRARPGPALWRQRACRACLDLVRGRAGRGPPRPARRQTL